MKCEKCLYRKNCQFLATHRKADVDGCTAFESEAELRVQIAREIIREIREAFMNMVLLNAMGETFDIEKRFAEIENKYTEDQNYNNRGIISAEIMQKIQDFEKG